MARITVEDCLQNVPNLFQLVLVASRRARKLANGAEATVIHADHLTELRADVALELGRKPERAAALVRESWRSAEEFNVNPSLWLDALFVQLRRAFA